MSNCADLVGFFSVLYYYLQFLRKQPEAAYLRNKKGGLYGKIHEMVGRQDYFSRQQTGGGDRQ
jgi:hypothetical protein